MKNYKLPEKPLLIHHSNLQRETILSMFQNMLRIRFAEERIALRIKKQEILTPCHLYIGQEADAVGVCSALKDSDYVFSTHRSHGHFLAKGGSLKELFAEIYCRETGCSGGRGGSMHLCAPEIGLLGSSSIVAGCLGIGIGPALRSKVLKENHVSVIFHGDCVPEEGIWHESLNFAAVNQLPVIYVCENNLYAASSALKDRRIYDNISKIAYEHGLQVEIVDGNDIFAVNFAAKKAVESARRGEGPQFIECRTYRWLGHVGPNDDIDVGLRDYNELLFWKNRCPISSLREWILKHDIANREEIDSIEQCVQEEIDEAEQYALNSSRPLNSTLYQNLYKERTM